MNTQKATTKKHGNPVLAGQYADPDIAVWKRTGSNCQAERGYDEL